VNLSFLRHEWGAVSFVLTVLVGIIIVPIALYFGHPGTKAPPAAASTSASASPSVSPTTSASAGPSASPTRSASPTASPR
jgi:hypothetical protein